MRYHLPVLGILSVVFLSACGQGLPDNQQNINNAPPAVDNARMVLAFGTEASIGSRLNVLYEYYDAEGDLEGNTRFQWFRDGRYIDGANASSYVIVNDDAGAELTVTMRPLALSGSLRGERVEVAGAVRVNASPEARNIQISGADNGEALMRTVLTATYEYFDLESDAESTTRYQWYRDDVPIVGATTASYTLQHEDVNHEVNIQVIPRARDGSSTNQGFLSAQPVRVLNAPPQAVDVRFSTSAGSVAIGTRLSLRYLYIDLEADAEGNTEVQWLRQRGGYSFEIPGADSMGYTVTAADATYNIAARITPLAQAGTIHGQTVSVSNPVYVNDAPRMVNVALRDSSAGQYQVGTQLTASWAYEDSENDPQGASYIVWYRDAQVIPGATSAEYVIQDADVGRAISFAVFPVAQSGTLTGEPVRHDGVYLNRPPVATQLRLQDNRAGQIIYQTALRAEYVYQDAEQDAEGATLVRWWRNGQPIGGASGRSYTLTLDDVGHNVSFSVQPVAASGFIYGEEVRFSGSVTVANLAPLAVNVHVQDAQGNPVTVANVEARMYARFQYSDHEGDAEGTHLYQWYRNGEPIAGETAEAYAPLQNDAGQSLQVEVTPVDVLGNVGEAVISASLLVVNAAPLARDVQLVDMNAGELSVGDTLQLLYTYYDPDGDPEADSVIRWYRDGVLIEAANSANYTTGFADSGRQLSASIEPHAQSGELAGREVSATVQTVSALAPPAVNIVAVDGQLQFSWTDVPGAVAYWLWENRDGASGFSRLNDDPLATQWSVDAPVLNFDWNQAQYYMQACDAIADGACISTPILTVAEKMLESIAHVKAVSPDASDQFGWQVKMSDDAHTMAISADGEQGIGRNIQAGNDPANNDLFRAGAVYLYHWNALSSVWDQPVYVKASNTDAGDLFGRAIALSGDGNTLAVGAPGEASSARGINGNQADNSAPGSGAVYVYRRDNGVWQSSPVYIKASNSSERDLFGTSVALSHDGNTLAVGAYAEDSNAGNIGGDQFNDLAENAGAVYLYYRGTDGSWSGPDYIKASNPDALDNFGISVSLSADGQSLAVGAHHESSSTTGINSVPDNDDLNAGAVYVYQRTANSWSVPVYIKAHNTLYQSRFGQNVELDADGDRLLVGAPGERSNARGVNGRIGTITILDSGAAYLYQKNSSGEWQFPPVHIKAVNPGFGDEFGGAEQDINKYFSHAMAMNATGDIIYIGAAREDSGGLGINPALDASSSLNAGAVYRYALQADGSWRVDYIKPASSTAEDFFGWSVDTDASGIRILIGSVYEDSDAEGVGRIVADAPAETRRDNENLSESGAAWLY